MRNLFCSTLFASVVCTGIFSTGYTEQLAEQLIAKESHQATVGQVSNISTTAHVAPYQPILFDTVNALQGGIKYNKATGQFTIPESGLYSVAYSVSVMAPLFFHSPIPQVGLLVDGNTVATTIVVGERTVGGGLGAAPFLLVLSPTALHLKKHSKVSLVNTTQGLTLALSKPQGSVSAALIVQKIGD